MVYVKDTKSLSPPEKRRDRAWESAKVTDWLGSTDSGSRPFVTTTQLLLLLLLLMLLLLLLLVLLLVLL